MALVAAGLLLMACDPNLKAPPSANSADVISQVPNRAPSVDDPLTADKFVADPCKSLTPAQLEPLGVGAGRPDNSDSGTACHWVAGMATDIQVAYLETKQGLTNYYILNDSRNWQAGYFEALEIQGYPAVFASESDKRPDGLCLLSVGISDRLVFTVTVTAQNAEGSCTTAKTVADDTVTTIRG